LSLAISIINKPRLPIQELIINILKWLLLQVIIHIVIFLRWSCFDDQNNFWDCDQLDI